MHKRTIILVSGALAACVAAIALLWLVGGGFSAHAALALSAVEGPADELHVCPSGCVYSSVQAAVDAAIPGDVIKVAQGVYTDIHARAGITQVVYISKTVTIQGGYTTTDWITPDSAANPTTLDAQGRGRVLYVTGDITLTAEGLRITGGNADGLGGYYGYDAGGGVYVSNASLVISDSLVYSNTAALGGGLFIDYSTHITLSGNTVTSNIAQGSGGGLYLSYSAATLTENTITGNTAKQYGGGGGVYLQDSNNATLNGNTISGNTARNGGGGLELSYSDATLNGNTISGNTAGEGGGVFVNSCDPILSGNVVTGNTADYYGGGLYLRGSDPTLVNNVVADNQATRQGSGVYVLSSSPRLLHTTIARNSGGDGSGVHVTDYGSPYNTYSTVAMTNTIIVSHTVGITVTAGNTATLNGTLWHANTTPWDGNVISAKDHTGDPTFAADGYHLTSGSAAFDRGVDAGVTTDIDGDARPQGGGYDIGADEFPAAPADVVWDKQIRINAGSLQSWDSGPFAVVPGDAVTIVERVWVTATWDASFTISEAWTLSLEWVDYQATIGTVSQSGLTATWSVTNAIPNAWHVLTKTLRVVTVPDYVDTLTETLTVQGATYQPPERIIEFQHRRPEPTWDKTVRINDGAPQAWDSGPFIVAPGDTMTITDRVWITHTTDVTFTLAQSWGAGLELVGWTNDAGAVVTGTGTLTWQGTGEAANQWHTLTATFHVTSTAGLRESLVETLTVEDAASQLPQRVVNLLISSPSGNCYARVNDGSTTYPTVQSAVDAAQAGDLVKVAGHCTAINLYGGLAQVVYLNKSLTVRGGYTTTNWTTPDPAAHPTTLDAQGQGRVMVITGTIAPTVEGLRITGGNADGWGGSPWGEDAGGGVYIRDATAVISGNFIYSNSTDEIGGGVYLHQSPSQLAHNIITSNIAQGNGGGLYLSYSAATLTENTITGNTAKQYGGGGGVYLRDSNNATLNGNTVSSNYAANGGGGLELSYSDATLNGNTISGNTASEGGGVFVNSCEPILSGNVVTGNTADYYGGGLYLRGSDPTLVNNVVADNQATWQGSGVYVLSSSPRLLHTTIARNSGGDGSGVHVTDYGSPYNTYSTVALTNTIIVSHTVGITVTAGNTATLNATLWHANTTPWDGNVIRAKDHTGDPAFAADGYHLTSVSAAIDKGVNAGVTTDIDGQARPQSLGYDIGADEFVCVALTGVFIGGPTTGTVGTTYTFTATVSPAGATEPITYTWSSDNLVGDQGTASATYRWTDSGSKNVQVTARNCGGQDFGASQPVNITLACTEVTDVDLTLATSGDIYTGTEVTFSANIIPDGAGKPYTYTVDYGDGHITTSTSSDDPLELKHTFTATGTYDVGIKVWNCDMTEGEAVTGTVEVAVSEQGVTCVKVAGVKLTLVTSGVVYTDTVVEFSADVAPDNADKLYTYTVDYGDGHTTTSTNSADPLELKHTFAATGTYDVEVAVWNCDMTEAGAVTDTVQVAVSEQGVTCVKVSGVKLTLVTTGVVYTNTVVEFSAGITPDNADKPYTYTIDYDDGYSTTATSSADPLTSLDHIFTTTGTRDVEIAVWNCDMIQSQAITDSVTLTVHKGAAYKVYLPLVVRNH